MLIGLKYTSIVISLVILLNTNFSINMEKNLTHSFEKEDFEPTKFTGKFFKMILDAQEFIDLVVLKNIPVGKLYKLLKHISNENLEIISTIVDINIEIASDVYQYFILKATLKILNKQKTIISDYTKKFYNIIIIIQRILVCVNQSNVNSEKLNILLSHLSPESKQAIKEQINCRFDSNNNNLLLLCIKNKKSFDINNLKNLIILGSNINALNYEGLSALNLAIRYKKDLINTLIENQANPNVLDIQSDLTPLMWSVLFDNKFLKLLLTLKNICLDQQNSAGDTALIISGKIRNYKAMRYLLMAGAQSKIKNKKSETVEKLLT